MGVSVIRRNFCLLLVFVFFTNCFASSGPLCDLAQQEINKTSSSLTQTEEVNALQNGSTKKVTKNFSQILERLSSKLDHFATNLAKIDEEIESISSYRKTLLDKNIKLPLSQKLRLFFAEKLEAISNRLKSWIKVPSPSKDAVIKFKNEIEQITLELKNEIKIELPENDPAKIPKEHDSLGSLTTTSEKIFIDDRKFFLASSDFSRDGKIAEARKVDEYVETFLKEGDVVDIKEMPKNPKDAPITEIDFNYGSNEAYRIKVRDDFGREMEGLFKPTIPGEEVKTAAELFAYEIDRKLGLGLVPVTVERTVIIDGVKRKGSFQYWVQSGQVGRIGDSGNAAKSKEMLFLDSLIGNTDRHKGNRLVAKTPKGPLEVAIDHGEALQFDAGSSVFLSPNPQIQKKLKSIPEKDYRSILDSSLQSCGHSIKCQNAAARAIQKRRELIFLGDHPYYIKKNTSMGLQSLDSRYTKKLDEAKKTLMDLSLPEEEAYKKAFEILGPELP